MKKILNKEKKCPNCKYYKLEHKFKVTKKDDVRICMIISNRRHFEDSDKWLIKEFYLCGNCGLEYENGK